MDVRRTGTSQGPAFAALLVGAAGLWCVNVVPALADTVFRQTILVSKATDSQLVNPWGIAEGPSSPFWISDNGTGLTTVYTVNGTTVTNPLTVTIPAPGGGQSAPTGQVFNNLPGAFKLADTNPAFFIFASEDGAISAWNPGSGTTAEIKATVPDAIYKGVAIADVTGIGGTLYATNFHAGTIDAFDSSFAPTSLPGGNFVDPTLPAGFAPFNDKVINGQLYVTYAMQDSAAKDDVPGAGNGFVDVFSLTGAFEDRLISMGPLNSPWGLQVAPSDPSWGPFAGALLVGNFGDGSINAFDISDGDFIGELRGTNGQPLAIDGLWGLALGNGSAVGGDANTLYFTAGPDEESGGLFGSLTPVAVPEPATWAMMLIGFAGLGFAGYRRGNKASAAIA